MTYSKEFLDSQPSINGWSLTGERAYTESSRGLLAVCNNCGFQTSFQTLNRFLTNTRRCRGCEFYTPRQSAIRQHWSVYRSGAKKRGLVWGLSIEQFEEIIIRPCTYCADSGKQKINGAVWPWSGIDRLDNEVGYTFKNSVPCCRVCNVAKNNLTHEEWIDKIRKWSEYARENQF